MSKRYTDTEKWKKRWFRELTPAEKSAWFYITEQCDNVGVWDADFEVAEFIIGEKIDWDLLIEKTNGNIEILDCGKWFLIDYCSFQHTDLSPDSKSKPIISYIKLLKKHNLFERVIKTFTKPLDSPSKGLKEKERVKVEVREEVRARERVKEREKEKEDKVDVAVSVRMTVEQLKKLKDDYGEEIAQLSIDKLSDYKQSSGKTYKSDYHAILTWVIEQVVGKDKESVKAVKKLKDQEEEKKLKLENDIEQGKISKLPPEKTKELIKNITKKSEFIDNDEDAYSPDTPERSPPKWG